MRYQGGKRRSARFIAPYVARLRDDAPVTDVADLFLGSCGVEVAFDKLGTSVTLGAEVCPAIIACYRAICGGWQPPQRLSREEYARIKETHGPDSTNPLTAFALAFCSFGGVWGAGRLPDDERHGENRPTCRYAAAKACKDLLALRPILQRMVLVCEDYRVAAERVPNGGVLYLDPPWRGTTQYRQAPSFSIDEFWAWAAIASRRWRVIVSESVTGPPPDDDAWVCAWRRAVPSPGLIAGKVECLWYRRDGLAARVLNLVPPPNDADRPLDAAPRVSYYETVSPPRPPVTFPNPASAPVPTLPVAAPRVTEDDPPSVPALEIPAPIHADASYGLPPMFPRLPGASEVP